MESFFSALKTERTARKTYRTGDDARADVFDDIERFYNPKRLHSIIGYMSPMDFEMKAGLAQASVIRTGCRPPLPSDLTIVSRSDRTLVSRPPFGSASGRWRGEARRA